jgi:hypothetical protein
VILDVLELVKDINEFFKTQSKGFVTGTIVVEELSDGKERNRH